MPTPLKTILECLTARAKLNISGPIACPRCGEMNLVSKYGFYSRFLFTGGHTIKIQRYLCNNDRCPRKTFSILPYPFLRIVRVGLCFLYELGEARKKANIRELSKSSGFCRRTVRRLLEKAKQLGQWLEAELKAESWKGLPWLQPSSLWTIFNHMFSQRFYPCCG